MANKINHNQGDTGTEPPDGLDFQDGDFPNPEYFDWFWDNIPGAIDNHASLLEAIDSDEDGVVDRSDELASGSVGSGLKGGDADPIQIEPAEFAGSGVEDDGTDNIAITDEYVEDLVNNLLDAGSNVSWNYDDANDTLTINTSALNNEEVEDAVAGLITGGTGISVSYDDTNSSLTISTDSVDADTVDGNHYSDIQTWVNNNADVPNADHADTAGDADTVDGKDAGELPQANAGDTAPTATSVAVSPDGELLVAKDTTQ